MQLEVSNEQIPRLRYERNVQRQIGIREQSLAPICVLHLVAHVVSLRHRVVVVERVAAFGLGECVVHVVERVECVHEVELRRVGLVEQLLLERVEVFPVVDNNLAVCGADEPLVVGFEEGHVEGVEGRVYRGYLLDLDGERVPLLHVDEKDLTVQGGAEDVVAAR